MAGLGDALASGCMSNSDYAVICSFFEQFGDKSGLLFPSFQDLQQMIDNNSEGASCFVLTCLGVVVYLQCFGCSGCKHAGLFVMLLSSIPCLLIPPVACVISTNLSDHFLTF